MNKLLVAGLAALAAAVVYAEAPRGTPRVIENDLKAAATNRVRRSHAEVAMRRHGGTCQRRLPGKSFLFLDCRTAAADDFAAIRSQIEEASEVPCAWRKGELTDGACPVALAKGALGKDFAGVAVLTSGRPDASTLTVLPEDCIAVLNVTPYYADGEAKGRERFEKELWRVVAFACGGVNSFIPYCVMKTVTKPSDLDKIECKQFNPDIGEMVKRDLGKWGFGRVETLNYRAACREGWAPAPTNEWQQAIWDKAQLERQFDKQAQEPTNPIRIKFDKNAKK